MTYLNPFELLQAFAGNGEEWHDFDERSLRRTRRRVIAEADLEGTLRFRKADLSKNEIAAILDELDDEDKFENHRTIYENKPLLNFLSNGDFSIFEKEDDADIYDLYCADFDLIAQPFALQFNKLFSEAFDEWDSWRIEQMSRFLMFVDDKHLHICFKGVEKSLTALIEKYEDLLTEVKNEDFDADAVENILDEVYEDIDTDTLNSLPDYFELKRDRVANAIDQIAVNLFNNYGETEIAFDLSEIADEISAEPLTEKRIKHNKGVFRDELSRIEFARRLKKIERAAAIAEKLKQFTKELNVRLVSSGANNKLGNRVFLQTLKKQIQGVLDFNEINSLSDEAEVTKDLRDSIALELKKLSVASYNHANNLDFSLSLIEMALQINVTPSTYSQLLKSKNHLISKLPSAQYPLFDKQFSVENIYHGSEKPKAKFSQDKNENRADGGSSYGHTQSKKYNKNYDTTPNFNFASSEMNSTVRNVLVTAFCVLTVFGGLGIYLNLSDDGGLSGFNAELKKMNSGAGFSAPKTIINKLNEVKLKKKILPINIKDKTLDENFYNQMTPDIKPNVFGEVRTFVWVDCRSESKSSTYNSVNHTSQLNCDLLMVDKIQNAVVLKKTFEEKIIGTGNSSQNIALNIPYKRIINYLIENSEK